MYKVVTIKLCWFAAWICWQPYQIAKSHLPGSVLFISNPSGSLTTYALIVKTCPQDGCLSFSFSVSMGRFFFKYRTVLSKTFTDTKLRHLRLEYHSLRDNVADNFKHNFRLLSINLKRQREAKLAKEISLVAGFYLILNF